MTRRARVFLIITFIVATGVAGAKPASDLCWSAINRWTEANLGLQVRAESVGFKFTSRGLVLRLENFGLDLPDQSSSETAEAVEIQYWPSPISKLSIHIEGLTTKLSESQSGQVENKVWMTLLKTLSETPNRVERWQVTFHDSQAQIAFADGGELNLEPKLALGAKSPSPIDITARIFASDIDCRVNAASDPIVECSTERLPIGETLSALSKSRALPNRVRSKMSEINLTGEAAAIQFTLQKENRFHLTAFTHDLGIEPGDGYPSMSGIEGRLELNEKGGSFELQSQHLSLSETTPCTPAAARGVVTWKTTGDIIKVAANKIETRSADCQLAIEGQLRVSPRAIDISGVTAIWNGLRFETRGRVKGPTIDLHVTAAPSMFAKTGITAKYTIRNTAKHTTRSAVSTRAGKPNSSRLVVRAETLDLGELSKWLNRKPSTSKDDRASTIDPDLIPLLDLEIKSLQHGSRKHGSLALRTGKSKAGVTIEAFRLTGNHQHLVVTSGGWNAKGKSLSVAKGWFETSNVGETFAGFGMPKSIDESPLRIGFDLSWPGAPWDFDRARLDGKILAEIAKGKFKGRSPSLERLLSLAAIDFGSLLGGGVEFERGKASFEIKEGKIRTKSAKLAMKIARFNFKGEADLERLSIDGKLHVIPLLSGSLLGSALNYFAPSVSAIVKAIELEDDSAFNQMKTHSYRVGDSLLDPSFSFESW